MSAELSAEFAKQFHTGPLIQGSFRLPMDAFSITVLFGPSGSGKTTILRCLAGLEHPDRGWIRFGNEPWFDAARGFTTSPQQRGIGYLFQEYALFPHLKVARNIAYGLSRVPGAERTRRVHELIDLLGLTGLEQRYPRQLSGGQQQRVALARVLARRPRLLLLDEPLSALDAATREPLRRQLRRLLTGFGIPTVLVTHDRIEALALGDRVLVIDQGRICQSGPVLEAFTRPADLVVARLVGVDSIVPGKIIGVGDGLTTVAVGGVKLFALAAAQEADEVYACIHAADVLLERSASHSGSARNRLPGRIETLDPEGPLVRIGLDCGFPLKALITRQACDELNLREGDTVTALIKAPAIHLIPRG
jgi:molybdate transport system ATP-binding protein